MGAHRTIRATLTLVRFESSVRVDEPFEPRPEAPTRAAKHRLGAVPRPCLEATDTPPHSGFVALLVHAPEATALV